jgi:hypothetical protein
MRICFGAISSQSSGTKPDSVAEIGVYNGSAAGAVLLNRSAFFTRVATQQNVGDVTGLATAPIIVSAVIEFCPVV